MADKDLHAGRQGALRTLRIAVAALMAAGAACAGTVDDTDVDQAYSAAFQSCIARAKTTVASERCTIAERDRQGMQLDRVYARRLAEAKGPDRAALAAAQAAWSKDAAAACDGFRARPGRWSAVRFVSCQLAQITRRRLTLESGGN